MQCPEVVGCLRQRLTSGFCYNEGLYRAEDVYPSCQAAFTVDVEEGGYDHEDGGYTEETSLVLIRIDLGQDPPARIGTAEQKQTCQLRQSIL